MMHTRLLEMANKNIDDHSCPSCYSRCNNSQSKKDCGRLKALSLMAPNEQLQHQQHRGSIGNVTAHRSPSFAFPKIKVEAEDLGPDYVPSNYDIMSGRGNYIDNQIGNRRFRVIISLHLDKYFAATRHQKTYIVISIVDTIRAAGGRFVYKDPSTQRWYDIGDEKARAKVGSALRDAARLASSLPKKRRRRNQIKGNQKASSKKVSSCSL